MAATCASCGLVNPDDQRDCAECGARLPHTASLAARFTSPSVFVGRQRELTALRTKLAEAFAGTGGLALLIGEPGIGKTRTANELAAHARRRGALVLRGRCYEGEGAPAYLPWAQVIRAYTRERDPEKLAAEMGAGAPAIIQIVPELRERLPGLPDPRAQDSPQARFGLFQAATTFLRNAALGRPLVIVLDDLHWADEPSLLLLEFVGREVRDARLLVLGACRDVGLDWQHPLTRTLGDLRRERVCEQLYLKGLSVDEVQAMVMAASQGPVPMPQSLIRPILQQTGGNPFFVEELLRHLAEIGAISVRDDHWDGDAHAITAELPEGVRQVVGRRLASLSGGCVRLLTLASAMPGEFGWEHLSAISGETDETLLRLLDEALAARIILEQTDAGRMTGAYEFSHALVRQTLYGHLSTPRRRRLHRQIAEAIERAYNQNLEPHRADLAYHLLKAGSAEAASRAVEYARQAGDRAHALFSYEEAARLYRLALQALELQQPVEEQPRYELLLALGEAQMKAGDRRQARENLQRAAGVARSLRSAEGLACAALGFGGAWVVWAERGEADGELVSLLHEALTALGDQDSVPRALVLTRLAIELYHADAVGQSLVLTRQAVEMARRVGDPTALGLALHARHYALWCSENHEECLATAGDILQVAAETGDAELALQGHRWLFSDFLGHGDMAGVDAAVAAYARLAEDIRQPLHLWLSKVMRSIRVQLAGNFDESERLAQEYRAIGQEVNGENALANFTAQLFPIRREQGRLGELEAAIARFAEQHPAVPAWRAMLALLYCELGRVPEARAGFERLAANDFADLPHTLSWPVLLALLAEICVALEDTGRAALLYDLLLPQAERNLIAGRGGFPCYGSAQRHLGLLATTLGKWGTAEAHFAAALRLNTAIGATALVARTRYEYAAMLWARGEPEDADNAERLLADTIEQARALGTPLLEAQARALQKRITVRERAHAGDHRDRQLPDGLTDREVDVLRLLASGHTNKEIAEELVVSVRTAEHHVTHIYGKIGARRRADATAYALRHSLLPARGPQQ